MCLHLCTRDAGDERIRDGVRVANVYGSLADRAVRQTINGPAGIEWRLFAPTGAGDIRIGVLPSEFDAYTAWHDRLPRKAPAGAVDVRFADVETDGFAMLLDSCEQRGTGTAERV